jgi:hypothetical protein
MAAHAETAIRSQITDDGIARARVQPDSLIQRRARRQQQHPLTVSGTSIPVATFTNAQPTGVARSGPCTAALDLRPAGAAASGIVPRRASADRRRDELALVLHALCESLGLVDAKAMSRSRAPRSPPTAHLRRPPSAGSTTPPATACWDLANSARCSRAPPAQSETVGAGAIMLVPQRMQGLGGSAHRQVACVGAS